MYKLFDLIRAVRGALQPYRVVVVWEGETIVHRAWTTSDAREWSGMYPASAQVDVMTRGLRFVSSRRGAACQHHYDFPAIVPTCGYTGWVL